MTPAKASFFAMGISFERRLAVQERNESEMVDARRTMPMLPQLRCGDEFRSKPIKDPMASFCCGVVKSLLTLH